MLLNICVCLNISISNWFNQARRTDHLVGPNLLRALWPLTITNSSWLVGSCEQVTAPLLQASHCYLLSYAWAKVACMPESTIASTFDDSFPPLPSYSDFCHQIPHWLSWESPTSHFHCKQPCCPPFLPTVQNQLMKPGSLPLSTYLTALLPRDFQFHQDELKHLYVSSSEAVSKHNLTWIIHGILAKYM